MKAAKLMQRPDFPLLKQYDLQNFYHLQMPRWLFTDPCYQVLSLEAKVAYSFLLNRFQLSAYKGWTNQEGEVFIIYTRKALAVEMQVSYRKVIESMKELVTLDLIWERRCGCGEANQIYLAKVEHVTIVGGSAPFHEVEQPSEMGDAEMALLYADEIPDFSVSEPEYDLPRSAGSAHQDLSDTHVKSCGNGRSASAETARQDLPKAHTSYTDVSHTDWSDTDVSQSVCDDGRLEEILEACALEIFPQERAEVFRAAIEQLYYTDSLRIGSVCLPQSRVRSRLGGLNAAVLQNADNKLKQTSRTVKNSMGYIMSVIFNAIAETEGELMTDAYLNTLERGGDPPCS
jgi:Replication initiator protein A (RepA) N-terminus.